MTGGYLHRTWRAETADGPLFIKRYSGQDWPLAKVTETLAVQQFLAERNLPVPHVLPSRDGAFAVPADDGVLAVMRFLPGHRLEPGEVDTDAAHAAGATLGRMHGALRDWPVRVAPAIPDTEQLLAHARQLLAAAQRRSADEMDRLAAAAADLRIRSLERRPIDPHDYRAARFQVLHGDYYAGNLLFTEAGAVAAVVDFDFCGPRWRGMEVGRAIVETALTATGRFRTEVASAFLSGYLAAEEMVPAERRTIFRLWYDYLLFSTYPLPLRYWGSQPLPHGWERLAERRHRLLCWLEEHLDDLEERVAVR